MTQIVLDKHIINTLDKASRINSNLKIKPNEDYIVTLSRSKSMLMTAPLNIELPREINIYDLKGFLATVNLIPEPILDLSSPHEIVISNKEGNIKTSFSDSDSTLIKNYLELERFPKINDDDIALSIELDSNTFESVMRSARVRGAAFIGFISDGSKIYFASFNKLDSGQMEDMFSIELGDDEHQTPFKKYYKLDNTDLEVLKGEGGLTFTVSRSRHISIVNTESKKLLFIVFDPASVYGE